MTDVETGYRPVPWAATYMDGPGDSLPGDVDGDLDMPLCGVEWIGYRCTRLPDHPGTHRAGTGIHVVAEWRDA